MATELTAKIRLVKCPRCRRLLPELPDIPVYKCGGCDAILVATSRRDSSHNTELGSQNRGSTQRREVDPPSEDTQTGISNHEAIIPHHGESNLGLNNGRDTNESGELSSENLVHSTLSVQQRNTRNDDESHHENGELSDGDLLKAEEASISSSSHEAIIPSSGECVIDPDAEEDQDEFGGSSSEQLVRRKLVERQTYARNDNKSDAGNDRPSGFSNQVGSEEESANRDNGKLPCRDAPEQEEYCISSPEATIPSSGECFIDPNDVKGLKECSDVSQQQLAHVKTSECLKNAGSNDESLACHDNQPRCSNQSYSRIEFASHGNADLSGRDPTKAVETSTSIHEVMTIPFSGESNLDPNYEKDQKEEEESHSEQLVQTSFGEHKKNASNIDGSPARHDEQSGSSDQVSSSNEVANRENDRHSSGDCSEDEIIDEILLLGEESPEADDSKEIHSNLERSGISNALATQVGTSISSKNLAPLAEQAEAPEETISHGSNRRIPVENFACMEVNQCSEPSGDLPGMAKFLTTKRSFACDASVPSYDGMDDQFLDHRRRSLQNNHEAANFLTTVERTRREESLMNSNAMARDPEIPIEGRNSQEILSHKKHYGVEYRERNQNDILQHRRQDISMQSRSRLRREKYQSKLSLLGGNCQGGYESGSASSSAFDEPHDSRMHSSDNFLDHDEDKVKLLRMVYELQDQLEKSCNLNGNASERVSMGSVQKDGWVPMYYNHQIPQEEIWHDSEYPSYYRRSGPQTNYPGQHSLSRMTSAVKAVSGPQVNYPGQHSFGMEHFPENFPHSRQMLPSEHWHNQGAHMPHIDHDYYSQYSSCSSSPQHFRSTQLSTRGIHMQSDYLSHRNHGRNYLREKNHLAKHHLRPMAGGAPFITCYYCLKLLQIPAEFLLVKRQCNRLKCGNCSKVLEFSLQSRTHIVPYVQSVAEPPSHEANEHDDYSLANGKRGSREIDDSNVLPPSSQQDTKKELGSKQSQNKFEHIKKSYQSGDPSSHAYMADKLSSEVGKFSTKSNSPLHRLMGYSSPSQVFKGLDASRRSMQRKY
ncbi:uncharacterized protein LOC120075389 [Benincasa hispida]|uniref:uncharacterized protein LOC120075389 n=1 Tax=Benincasa hispida TaxID=102211 RepID=UPI0018FF1770|nr:uncharacterized protein LOC120075389 [Benincasa hispida]XP_038884664.1 uncharacterized protein LOC120075389 [Benincasa hispida]XP_038884665.1 uncharacterized protein LOC120075389 [Benincasa hispida]